MIIPAWALMATAASIIWGFSYSISGHLMKAGISPSFLVLISSMINLPFYLFMVLKIDGLQNNLTILSANKGFIWLMVAQAIAIVAGIFLIYSAIQQKNATYASIIEISYPLFVCLFSWALFREVHMSWTTALGGLLIFAGSALVFLRSGT
jgi:drug/metabolite transporter (DMT)-like permease